MSNKILKDIDLIKGKLGELKKIKQLLKEKKSSGVSFSIERLIFTKLDVRVRIDNVNLLASDPKIRLRKGAEKKLKFPLSDLLLEMLIDWKIKDLNEALKGADAVIFAVRHEPYLNLDPEIVVKQIGAPAAIIDCFGILDDEKIRQYFELGCEVKALGRGHIQRIKEEVRKA